MRLIAIGWLIACALADEAPRQQQPNVILILADDLGWSNVGFRRAEAAASGDELAKQASREIHTPHVDALAKVGIRLERHYGAKICSPSRCSLQSGRRTMHVNAKNTGVLVENPSDPVSGFSGIPRNMTGLAQKMKDGGYATAMTGKWDAGMATPEHTPFGRGFDQWLGYFQHANHYWNKRGTLEATGALDLCLNRLVDFHLVNESYRGGVLDAGLLESNCSASAEADPACYEEHIFKRHALDVLSQHAAGQADKPLAARQPLFYFHAFHLVHSPLQVPISYVRQVERLAHPHQFDDAARKNFSAMVLYMDEVVGELVASLHDHDLWRDSLVLFLVDNGGPLYEPGGANNHPLRGGKYSDWEGGVRTTAIVAGGQVPPARRGATYGGVVHISDWFGALCDLAGVDWTDVRAEEANARIVAEGLDTPLLYPVESARGVLDAILAGNDTNLNPVLQLSDQGLLQWPYKLVTGLQPFTVWTGPLFPNCTTVRDDDRPPVPWMNDSAVFDLHLDWSLNRTELHEHLWSTNCGTGCLFNVETDPEERIDLANDPEHAGRLADLQATLAAMNAGLFLPDRGNDAAAACHIGVANGGYFGPFVDADDYYTGPWKNYTWREKERNKLFLDVVDTLARPVVNQATVEFVRRIFPEWLRDPLESTFDECYLDDAAGGA